MKNYLKNELKHLPFTILVFIFLYGIIVLADSYALRSLDITFDNTNTNLESINVQDAIDEVYNHATDYNEIKNTIGTGSLTTTSQTLIGGINEVKGLIPTVEDSLTSTSTTNALSAAKGKALSEQIVGKTIYKTTVYKSVKTGSNGYTFFGGTAYLGQFSIELPAGARMVGWNQGG